MSKTSRVALALTATAAGRAMTLAFIARAGDGGPGDPPAAWLMPLIGDAAIGLAAVVIAALIWRSRTVGTWVAAIAWSAIGAFDALAAYVVEVQTPWPDFFMIEIFGRSMFFVAAALHLAIVVLLMQPDARADFGVANEPLRPAPTQP